MADDPKVVTGDDFPALLAALVHHHGGMVIVSDVELQHLAGCRLRIYYDGSKAQTILKLKPPEPENTLKIVQ